MTAKDEYTIEMMGLDHYAQWWEAPEEGSKYGTRWEKLRAAVREKELITVAQLVREAHVEAYKAGVVYKITGS